MKPVMCLRHHALNVHGECYYIISNCISLLLNAFMGFQLFVLKIVSMFLFTLIFAVGLLLGSLFAFVGLGCYNCCLQLYLLILVQKMNTSGTLSVKSLASVKVCYSHPLLARHHFLASHLYL